MLDKGVNAWVKNKDLAPGPVENLEDTEDEMDKVEDRAVTNEQSGSATNDLASEALESSIKSSRDLQSSIASDSSIAKKYNNDKQSSWTDSLPSLTLGSAIKSAATSVFTNVEQAGVTASKIARQAWSGSEAVKDAQNAGSSKDGKGEFASPDSGKESTKAGTELAAELEKRQRDLDIVYGDKSLNQITKNMFDDNGKISKEGLAAIRFLMRAEDRLGGGRSAESINKKLEEQGSPYRLKFGESKVDKEVNIYYYDGLEMTSQNVESYRVDGNGKNLGSTDKASIDTFMIDGRQAFLAHNDAYDRPHPHDANLGPKYIVKYLDDQTTAGRRSRFHGAERPSMRAINQPERPADPKPALRWPIPVDAQSQFKRSDYSNLPSLQIDRR